MKTPKNLSLIIGIATTIFAMGGSYAIVSSKAQDVDKVKDKTENLDKRVIKLEVSMDNIDEALKDQKIDTKELKSDIKEILKAIKG